MEIARTAGTKNPAVLQEWHLRFALTYPVHRSIPEDKTSQNLPSLQRPQPRYEMQHSPMMGSNGKKMMVPKKGLEPPHPCGYMDLNHARLPIPPLRQVTALRSSLRAAVRKNYSFYSTEALVSVKPPVSATLACHSTVKTVVTEFLDKAS
jgi:hypothetical protein